MHTLPYKRRVDAALFPGLLSSLHGHLFLVCNTQLCLVKVSVRVHSTNVRNLLFRDVYIELSLKSAVFEKKKLHTKISFLGG